MSASTSFVGLSRAHFVETQARRLEGLERSLLHLSVLRDRRSIGRAGKRPACHRPMVRVLCFLQCGQRFLVLPLPLHPCAGRLAHNSPNLRGPIASSVGSTRPSITASATICAVNGASSTPF